MQDTNSERTISVLKIVTALVIIFLTCFTLVSRLTKNAFPAVEEWATYGHKSQIYSFTYQLRRISTNDPRFTFSGGSLAFFPVGWIDWPLSLVCSDPVVALRLSISSFLFLAGLSVFLVARHIGCSLKNSMFAAICWLSTVFSISSWTSMPRLLAIPLFCFLFIGASTGLKNARKAHFITIIVCILGIAIPANPPALFAALLGLPLGFLYGGFHHGETSEVLITKLKKHLLLYLYPLTIFGPLLFIEWKKLRDNRPEVQVEEFSFSWKLLLKNAMGRGFWWEYGSEGTTRYAPFADAFDGSIVRVGMFSLVFAAFSFTVVVIARQIFSRIITKGKFVQKQTFQLQQLSLLGIFSVCFLLLSSAHSTIPGFAALSKRFSPLQMFREPFAKFNGIYLVLVILTFFASTEFLHVFFVKRFINIRNWIIESLFVGSSMLMCTFLLSVVTSSSFPYEKDSRGVIPLERVREIRRLSEIIDSKPNKSKELCILFSGVEEYTISWEQANTERILMAFTSKQSDTWIIPGVVLQAPKNQCRSENLVIEIDESGEIELKR
jgi:hypothetical protein